MRKTFNEKEIIIFQAKRCMLDIEKWKSIWKINVLQLIITTVGGVLVDRPVILAGILRRSLLRREVWRKIADEAINWRIDVSNTPCFPVIGI